MSEEATVKTIELSDQQLAFVIIALRDYASALLESGDEEPEDSYNDYLVVQGTIKQLETLDQSDDRREP